MTCCTQNTITSQCILPGCESLKEELDDSARRQLLAERGYLLYDELDENAKEAAVNWFRTNWPDYGWWDVDYSSIAEIFSYAGVACATESFSFSLDRENFFQFSGSYTYKKGWKKAVNRLWGFDIFKLPMESAKFSHTIGFLQEFAEAEHRLQKRHFYCADVSFSLSGRYSVSPDVRITAYDCVQGHEVSADDERAAEDMLQALVGFGLGTLQASYDFITSEEYAIDTIKANEYGFDMSGNRI